MYAVAVVIGGVLLSVVVTVKLELPVAVGVPLSVFALRVTPAGSAPDVTAVV